MYNFKVAVLNPQGFNTTFEITHIRAAYPSAALLARRGFINAGGYRQPLIDNDKGVYKCVVAISSSDYPEPGSAYHHSWEVTEYANGELRADSEISKSNSYGLDLGRQRPYDVKVRTLLDSGLERFYWCTVRAGSKKEAAEYCAGYVNDIGELRALKYPDKTSHCYVDVYDAGTRAGCSTFHVAAMERGTLIEETTKSTDPAPYKAAEPLKAPCCPGGPCGSGAGCAPKPADKVAVFKSSAKPVSLSRHDYWSVTLYGGKYVLSQRKYADGILRLTNKKTGELVALFECDVDRVLTWALMVNGPTTRLEGWLDGESVSYSYDITGLL